MLPRLTTSLLALIFALPLLPAGAQEYEIRIQRPSKVGEKFRATIGAKEIQELSITANGKPVQSEKKEVSVGFSGVVEILEVEAKGRAVKISATVDKLLKNEAGTESEIAPKDAVLVVSMDGKKQLCQINGMPAGDALTKAMELIFTLSQGGPTDDDVMGTSEKKKVGDSWDIHAAVAKKYFAESHDLKTMDLTGKVTLDGIVHRTDGDALKLIGTMSLKALPPMPPQFVIDESKAEARLEGEFPVDVTRPSPNGNTSLKMNIIAHGETPNGDKIVLTSRMEKSTREQRAPLE